MSSNAAFSMNKFFQLCNLIQGQAQVIRNIFSRLHLFGTISHILILPFGATNRKLLLEDCPPSTPPLPPPPFRLQFLSLGFCRVVFFFFFPQIIILVALGAVAPRNEQAPAEIVGQLPSSKFGNSAANEFSGRLSFCSILLC